MTTRDAFLAKVRASTPPPVERLPLQYFPATATTSKLERFESALAAMGGTSLSLGIDDTLAQWITTRFGNDAIVCSAVKDIEGTRPISAATVPKSLEDVDVGVVRARFGVAETGSLWFSEAEYVVNSIGYIVQHLVVLLDPTTIVDGLQDVYRKPDFKNARYAALVTGPSATADIEGVLIRGAQGVRSLTVILDTAASTTTVAGVV
jgi:L-lactate dehydrogenase complex protein LldG